MPGRKQAPQYTYTLSAHLYVKATAHQSPAPKTPSPYGGGLGRVDNSTNEPLSLWERGWGEGCECEKCRHPFINSTANPFPNPPPLRASPCRGGGLFNYQHNALGWGSSAYLAAQSATTILSKLAACLLLACAALHPAQAQDATAGLYICPAPGGMNNIVSKPTGDNCRPYQKGALGGNNPAPAAAPAPQPVAQPTPLPIATPKPAKNETAKGGYTWDEDDTPAKPTAKNNAPAKAPETPANNLLFPPAPNYSSDPRGGGNYYRDLAIRPGKPGTPAAATPAVSTPPPAPAEEKTVATVTPSGKQIWVCPQLDGTPTIIETATPPQGNCQPLGRKGGETSAPALPAPNRGKPLVGFTPGDGEEIAQDIYKCFDNEGTPNFVPANKRDHYRHCTFFSRSYSGAKQEFRQQATQSQSLEALAAAGVQKNTNPATNGGPGLQCTGAGSIAFNGETREFNCATRSFDYTPGTSGGEARLGNQQTNIAAHNLDYLNTQGSCGGTVTSENGRVFHLEPTKDCPQSYVIEAERLAAKIRNELNINVSGAFRERQRNLSAQINQIAAEVGIEPHFVHAIVSAESAYIPTARSRAGAMGLMQLMPGTARRFGVTDAYNTGQNITGGATYLKWLLNEFGGDMQLAAAGYNAGEGNVKKYGNKIPPFIETRAYVPKVMEYYRRYKANPSEIGL